MKLCLLQTDIDWNDPFQNIINMECLLAAHPMSDFYVLPEMWCTGFNMQPDADTAEAGEAGLVRMEYIARQLNVTMAGSLPLRTPDGCGFTNTFILATPDKTYRYDKYHLFTYGGEQRAYTAGSQRVVVEVKGWRVLLQVCYDLRFPVFSRSRSGDYDLILYVANWPASRQGAWDTLLRARAIENLAYVVGVNRVGTDPACTYGGGSAVISPRGETLVSLGNKEAVGAITLGDDDKDALDRFRKKFPALDDADAFTLEK